RIGRDEFLFRPLGIGDRVALHFLGQARHLDLLFHQFTRSRQRHFLPFGRLLLGVHGERGLLLGQQFVRRLGLRCRRAGEQRARSNSWIRLVNRTRQRLARTQWLVAVAASGIVRLGEEVG